MPDSQRPIRVMFVDDETRILRSLTLQFRRDYEVVTESDPYAALRRLEREQVDILVSDQRMPGMNGAELLARARRLQPDGLRILLTGYSDLDAAVQALNDGEIFRYLTKPWNPEEMAAVMKQAAQLCLRRRHALRAANDHAGMQPAEAPPPSRVSILLLDADPAISARVVALCDSDGHRLLRAARMEEAVDILNRENVDVLISDLRLGERATAPLLKSLAHARPRALTIVTTPFQDTQALLALINQAQIFRYVLKPISLKLFERALRAAIEQARLWHSQPQAVVARAAEAPRDEGERATVNSLIGMLGRLRGRFSMRA